MEPTPVFGDSRAVSIAVPGRMNRALNGIVVRDGTFYWSGLAMFVRIAIVFFVFSFLGRFIFLRQIWPDEPEWMGVPGLSMPIAGQAAISGVVVAALLVVLSYRNRRRFNAAPPRVGATSTNAAAMR